MRIANAYWGEHVARYKFAQRMVQDCRVLDIACGTGFGIPCLSAKARLVVGVDLEWEAVSKASHEIYSSSVSVLMANGCSLPFQNCSFDVATSFETLEHLEARSGFLAELRRVLKPGGLCILSTPNAHYTQPVNGKPQNPFHVFEYTPEELVAELSQHFSVLSVLGQTLAERFSIPPFQDAQNKLPRTPWLQVKLIGWRLVNKLPLKARERLSQIVWQEPFYPGEYDYQFSPLTTEGAPVLLALCQRSESEGEL